MEEAERMYRKLLELRPKSPPVRRGLAELLLRTQRPGEVGGALDGVRSDLAWNQWLLAQAAQAQGQREQALSHARRVLELDPNHEAARSFLSANGEDVPARR